MKDTANKHNREVFINVKKILLYCVALTCCVVIFISLALRAQANIVATVLPSMYSANGSVLENNDSENTSQIQYEYVWDNFNIGINEGESVHNALLKFSWSFIEPTDEIPFPTNDENQIITPEATSSINSENTLENSLEIPEIITPLIIEIEENVDNSLPQEVETPAQDTQEEDIPETEFQDVSLYNKKYLLVLGQFEENFSSTTEENSNVIESVGTGAQEQVDTSEPPTSETVIQNITTFEILYSLDGQQWEKLNGDEFNMPGEVTLKLPQFSSKDIQNLKIMIRYVKSQNDSTKIFFDNVHLVIDFDNFVEEEPVPVEQEPNFDISAINADTQSGNIRAVIIEKGGMLELWYSITDTMTQKVSWNKLLNDASLDESSPLEIKGRTIFWLDKNKQTLFGFDIDTQSIFGDAIDAQEQSSSLLPFEDEHAKQWAASFDADNNVLEFSKRTPIQ